MKTIYEHTRSAAIRGMLALASACVGTACAGEPNQAAQTQRLSTEPADVTQANAFTHFVVLGDSFSAGTGLPNPVSKCYTNQQAWPRLVASKLNADSAATGSGGPPTVDFVACSGAKLENITAPQPARDVGTPQLDAIKRGNLPASTLVMLTIGGNDGGALDFMTCLEAVSQSPGAASEAMCNDLATSITHRIDTEVAPKLLSTFTTLKKAAPAGATIVAVGYPHTLSSSNNALCSAFQFAQGVPPSMRTLFNSGIDRLNTVIANAAHSAGILSITDEIVTAFQGHELCADDEYLVGLSDPLVKTEAAGHPNAAGNQAYVVAVLAGLMKRGGVLNSGDVSIPVAGSAAPLPGSTPVPGSTPRPGSTALPRSTSAATPPPGASPARPSGAAGAASVALPRAGNAGSAMPPRAAIAGSAALPLAGIGGSATAPRIATPAVGSAAQPRPGATPVAGSRAGTPAASGVAGTGALTPSAAGSGVPGASAFAGSGALTPGAAGFAGSGDEEGDTQRGDAGIGDAGQAGEGGSGAEQPETLCTPGGAEPCPPDGTEPIDAGQPNQGAPSGSEPGTENGDPGTADPGEPACVPDEDGNCL